MWGLINFWLIVPMRGQKHSLTNCGFVHYLNRNHIWLCESICNINIYVVCTQMIIIMILNSISKYLSHYYNLFLFFFLSLNLTWFFIFTVIIFVFLCFFSVIIRVVITLLSSLCSVTHDNFVTLRCVHHWLRCLRDLCHSILSYCT